MTKNKCLYCSFLLSIIFGVCMGYFYSYEIGVLLLLSVIALGILEGLKLLTRNGEK